MSLFSKILDDVIACDLLFGLPSQSNVLDKPEYLIKVFPKL